MDEELIYEKLPGDIAQRHVLLMDPILATGNSAARAIQVSTCPFLTDNSISMKAAGMLVCRAMQWSHLTQRVIFYVAACVAVRVSVQVTLHNQYGFYRKTFCKGLSIATQYLTEQAARFLTKPRLSMCSLLYIILTGLFCTFSCLWSFAARQASSC